MGRLVVYRSKTLLRSERWRWRLVAENGDVVAESGEGYANVDECITMGRRIIDGDFTDAVTERR